MATQESASVKTEEGLKLRPPLCEFNPLTRSDGSVMFAQGSTVVIAAIVGPIEVKSQNLSIDNSSVECHFRPKAGLPTVRDKIREAEIKDICDLALLTEMHPRTKMSVEVQELEDRGGMDATSINAACLALLIGGLPLKYTFAAVHCVIDRNNELILDPDICQMVDFHCSFLFVYDSTERNLLSAQTKGAFNMSQFIEAENSCRVASLEIFDFYRQTITEFHTKSLVSVQFVSQKNEVDGDSMES